MTAADILRGIAAAKGNRTLMAPLIGFHCGLCKRDLPADQHDGGVWARDADGKRLEHVSLCKECSEANT